MSTDPLSVVCDHLNRHSYGLTPKKVRERGEVVDVSDDSERIVFDVERHRGKLGAQYIEGMALPAFETYWKRYVFDRQEEKIEAIEENAADDQESTLEIQNYHRLAEERLRETFDLSVKPREEGYEASETVGGDSRLVQDKEQFLDFARDQHEKIWLAVPRSPDVVLKEYGWDEEEIQDALSRLKSAELRYVEKEAERTWALFAETGYT